MMSFVYLASSSDAFKYLKGAFLLECRDKGLMHATSTNRYNVITMSRVGVALLVVGPRQGMYMMTTRRTQ